MVPKKTAVKKREEWKPPRGVSMRWRKERDRWEVLWREGDGTKRRQTFTSKAEAERKARDLAQVMGLHGRSGLVGLDADAVRDLSVIRDALDGAPVAALLECWRRHGQLYRGGMTVSEAVAKYLDLTDKEGTHRVDTRRQVELAMRRFDEGLGTRAMPSLSTDEIRAWVDSAARKNGLGDDAKNSLTKQVRALYNRGVEEGWCLTNPARAVKTVAIVREEVSVLSAADALKLFDALRDEPVSLHLAIEAFGGIRHSGTSRLSRDDFKRDRRGMLLPAKSAKGAKGKQRRHYTESLPANLWAWIDRWWDDDRPWDMTAAQVMHAKSKGFEKAKVPHPKNVLRHSFASYHVALHEDAAKTALLMQHTSQVMLWQHYKGIGTKADSGAYFAIHPWGPFIPEPENKKPRR